MKNRSIIIKEVFTGLLLLCLFLAGPVVFGRTAPQAGDVNGDGLITITDALLTARYCAGITPASFFPTAADVNGNSVVEITDAMLIAQYSAGLINSFPVSAAVQVVQSGLGRDLTPQPASGELASVVAGNNQFAFDMYKQLCANEDNLFFSPVSITLAFAMCYAGAREHTKQEIAGVMHFTLTDDRLHNAFNALELTLTALSAQPPRPDTGEELKLHIANSSWGEKQATFVPLFLDTLARYYGAGMNLVDFLNQPENCRGVINTWVAAKTEQRIKDLLPAGTITADTRLVLTNAIYFKANWFTPFDVNNTANAPFHLPDGSTVSVPMMSQKIGTAYCEEPGQYQAVRLLYQGTKRNAMLIILPAEGRFLTVENALSPAAYSSILQKMTRHEVTLSLPQFSYEWGASLLEPLHVMGMKDAFNPMAADFSGINGKHTLFISDVMHKSFVAVDEKGTEASAATAIVFSETSLPVPVTMTIDRPFLYFIYNEETGAILFCGRVMQP